MVNELTNDLQEGEARDRTNIDAFVENYLSVPQRDDLEGELGETPDFLEIASFEAYETAENVGVFGTVENVGDDPIDGLEVEVTPNDGDTVVGEFVDTADAERDHLPAGKQWRFNVVFEDENRSQATGFTVSADGDMVENSAFGNNTSDALGNDTEPRTRQRHSRSLIPLGGVDGQVTAVYSFPIYDIY